MNLISPLNPSFVIWIHPLVVLVYRFTVQIALVKFQCGIAIDLQVNGPVW